MLKLAKSEQLFQNLKKRINQMSEGDRFPSVRQLMKEYDVSQFTVAPALQRLEEQGLVERLVGKGTFVRKNGAERTKNIVYLDINWPSVGLADIEHSLSHEAQKRSFKLKKMLYEPDEDIYPKLADLSTDAIIINPLRTKSLTPEQLQIVLQLPVPVVFLEKMSDSRLNFICGNDSFAGVTAASHLIKSGHKKLAVLISEPKLFPVMERIESFIQHAKNNGAEVTLIDCEVEFGEYSPEKTYNAFNSWLNSHSIDFTALFVVSDESALGAIKALNEHKIKVPKDLSLISNDNISASAYFTPPLTTIGKDRAKEAAQMFDIIEAIIADDNRQGHQATVYPQLFERESTRSI